VHKKLLFGGVAISVAAVVVLTAQTVFAHSRPIRFDPPAGAVLASAPAKIDGWFTQPLRRDPNWNFLKVTNEQGTVVSTGEPILSADRKQMSVQLQSALPPGRYLVTWRTWDDNDGRIFGDCYAFFVGQAAADAAVSANTRLDGGNTCQRIDISGTDGTPVAGGTPQATAVPGNDGHEDEGGPAESSDDDDSGGVAVWVLMLGVAGGVAVGLVGGRMIGGKS
jgi:methionine-rich copper-binding protein CopC